VAWRGKAGRGEDWQRRQGGACHGAVGKGSVGYGKAGEAWHGPARQGLAGYGRQGGAWLGAAGPGEARQARRGEAWPGLAGSGKARAGFPAGSIFGCFSVQIRNTNSNTNSNNKDTTMIHAQIVGRIGRDAEIKTTPSGATVCKFAIATNSGFGDNQETFWINCSMWGGRAEKIVRHLTKGSSVLVVGELKTRTFPKNDGSTGHSLELRVAELEFAGRGPDHHNAASDTSDHTEHSAPAQPQAQPASARPRYSEDDIPF